VVGGGEILIAEICDPTTRIGAAFRYLGAGAGMGAKITAAGPSDWENFTVPRSITLSDFAGNGSITAAGVGIGGYGIGSTVLIFSHPSRITGRNVNVEFSGAPLWGGGFSATSGDWVMSALYPIPL